MARSGSGSASARSQLGLDDRVDGLRLGRAVSPRRWRSGSVQRAP